VNPSTALATVFVDELIRNSVRDVVLAPGSRSAPLAYALHAAEQAGRLRLHVRIDERTAGFLAVGLAKASERPVVVVTTSGTAVANLHPAVLEAHHAGVPLLLLTADRPPELRGTGANQTTDQLAIFGRSVRLFHEVGAPEERPGQNAYWRALVSRAVTVAHGDLSGDPGPVHLNVAFREPLTPDLSRAWPDPRGTSPPGYPPTAPPEWPEPLEGRPRNIPWVSAAGHHRVSELVPDFVGDEPRTLVIVGDAPARIGRAAAELAERQGWPLVVEPSSGAWGATSVEAGGLLLHDEEWVTANAPERVLVVGRPTLSRAVAAVLRRPGVAVDVVSTGPRWADPGLVARHVMDHSQLRTTLPAEPAGDPEFRSMWMDAGHRVGKTVDEFLSGEPALTGFAVARELFRSLHEDALVVLGSSNPIRDVDLAAVPPPQGTRVLANRGLAGIDGTVSTAIGAALHQSRSRGGPAYALLGDLTFLHDITGLVLGPQERRPELTIVVTNDGGGGIFTLLEHGSPKLAPAFERVLGTPHGVDLAALCAAMGTTHTGVNTVADLRAALASAPLGLSVVEAQVSRAGLRDLHARLRAAVAATLRS
jgi:2-succinyl-5-enolpyruvyl-6-hydroxy-3-cyclohexene-1-carboxylate synthase